MNLPKLNVGDELILRTLRGNPNDRTATVTRIGRKWAYAAPDTRWASEIKFDMVSGYEDGRGFQSLHRLLTPEMDATETRIREARAELRAEGVQLDPHAAKTITVESIEAIATILRNAKEAQS